MADSDFGIKISQPGKDVQDSGDAELLFSSSWPVPKIVFQGELNGSVDFAGGTTVTVIKHPFGYVPMFIPYQVISGEFHLFRAIISADNKNIYYTSPGPIGGFGLVRFGLFIFDVDIEKNFEAPVVNTGTSSSAGVDRNFGIKLSKEGKDTDSTDLRDFIIHSSTRSPLLHAVSSGYAKEPGSSGLLVSYSYKHTLPYTPMFLAYAQNIAVDGAYTLINNFAGLSSIKDVITIEDLAVSTNPKASIVVLKDPFIINDMITELK